MQEYWWWDSNPRGEITSEPNISADLLYKSTNPCGATQIRTGVLTL